ncbi:MAG TPA: hypothetical protein VM307_07730 [Egibacteraceae bacterium]|nr:hypothetical protein [Egibacteraceae bacterium]
MTIPFASPAERNLVTSHLPLVFEAVAGLIPRLPATVSRRGLVGVGLTALLREARHDPDAATFTARSKAAVGAAVMAAVRSQEPTLVVDDPRCAALVESLLDVELAADETVHAVVFAGLADEGAPAAAPSGSGARLAARYRAAADR